MSAFVSLVGQDDREKDEKIEVKLLRSEGGLIHQQNEESWRMHQRS